MSSRFKIAPRVGNDEASPEIKALAKDLLTADRLAWAEGIAHRILSTKAVKWGAIRELCGAIGDHPDLPLGYLRKLYVPRLPHFTREVVRYSGDYVDILTKEAAADLLQDSKRRTISLEANSRRLLEKGPPELGGLFDFVTRFCSFLYTPGKHEFKRAPGRDHMFTAMEAVLCIVIALELGSRICAISERARSASETKPPYSVGGEKEEYEGAVYVGED